MAHDVELPGVPGEFLRPRFESLMRDRVIRLRLTQALPVHAAVYRAVGHVCRGWRLMDWTGEAELRDGKKLWLWELRFTPTPNVTWWDKAGNLHTITAEYRFGTADFDAMLSALEPYELVEPCDPGTIDFAFDPIVRPDDLLTEAGKKMLAVIRPGSNADEADDSALRNRLPHRADSGALIFPTTATMAVGEPVDGDPDLCFTCGKPINPCGFYDRIRGEEVRLFCSKSCQDAEATNAGYCSACGGEHGEHRRGCPVAGNAKSAR